MKSNFNIIGLLLFLASVLINTGCKNNESKGNENVKINRRNVDSLKLKEESLTQFISWEWAKGAIGTNESGDFSEVNGKCIVTDSKGNVYVVGDFKGAKIAFDNIVSKGVGDFRWNSFFTKYDSKGTVVWVKIIKEYSETNLAIDSEDNIYMTCDESFISKWNCNGDKIWEKETDLSQISIAINSLKGFYIIGINDYPNRKLVKYDSNGKILWNKELLADDENIHNRTGILKSTISVDKFGDIYLSGGYDSKKLKFENTQLNRVGLNCSSEGSGCDLESTNGFLIKCNSNGNVIWTKNIGEISKYNYTFFNASCTNEKGDIYLVGQSNESGFGDAFLTKYNRAGILQWTKIISNCDKMNHRINSVSVNNFGNIYITGFSWCESMSIGQYHESATNGNLSFIVKYNQNGNVLCTKSLENIAGANNKVISEFMDLSVDNSGNVFITGSYEDGGVRFGKSILAEQQQMGRSFFITKLNLN